MIIGSAFQNYNSAAERAFQKLGMTTSVYSSKMMGINRFALLTRVKRKLGFNVSSYYSRLRDKHSKRIIEQFDEFNPDCVFVRLGNMMTEDAVRYLKGKAKLILYLTDPISKLPEVLSSLKYYDAVYTYETTDVEAISQYTECEVKTMFGLFDETVFQPLNCKKTIDVYFVGAMYRFRVETIINLINDFPDLKFRIDGSFAMFPDSKQLLKQSSPRVKKCFSKRNISDISANLQYNKSRICLNLQHPQTKDGWNSRLTEILGSGALEIVTANPSVCRSFESVLLTYSNYQELKDAITYYCSNEEDCARMAKAGYERAFAQYTYSKAFQRILSEIQ